MSNPQEIYPNTKLQLNSHGESIVHLHNILWKGLWRSEMISFTSDISQLYQRG